MKLALPALIGAAAALAACTEYPPAAPVAVAVPVAAVPAAATAPAPPAESCFYTRDILNHQIADDHTMYIRTRSNAIYRLDMVGACLAAASNDDPLVIRTPPGVQYACRAVDLDISIAHNAGITGIGTRTPCIVDRMMRLTDAEIAALPPRVRP